VVEVTAAEAVPGLSATSVARSAILPVRALRLHLEGEEEDIPRSVVDPKRLGGCLLDIMVLTKIVLM